MTPPRRRFSWLLAQPYAHRGLWSPQGPAENSLSAFEAAAAAGLGAELDVRLTADGAPVVFHDSYLFRMTGAAGRIEETPTHELSHLTLSGSGERPPLLVDVLAGPGRSMALLIELKVDPGAEGPLEAAVARLLERHHGPAAVMSFNPSTMAWFARYAPGIARGMLADRFSARGFLRAPWAKRRRLRDYLDRDLVQPDFFASSLRALTAYGAPAARTHGAPLFVWTIRTPKDALRAARHADGLIFEHFPAVTAKRVWRTP